MFEALKDKRYIIALEFCGYDKPRYVARFCGDWLGQSLEFSGALLMVINHQSNKDAILATN